MRSRSVAVAILVSMLCAGGAVASFVQAQKLRTEANWLLARSAAQAQTYAETFDGSAAEEQLGTFEERREVLDRAALWQRAQMLLVLAAVIAAFSSYVLYLFRRLRDQLLDVADPLAGLDDHHRGPPGEPKAMAAL
ncbi:MAG: hypothetical protein M3Y59_14165 [Myxococcota bacterium]|nr:hypothetical protein [Myxococcota bacterium]